MLYEKKVLILDDSISFTQLLSIKVKNEMKMETIVANSFQHVKEIIKHQKEEIFLVISDWFLPDSEDSIHIDFFIEQKLPCIVITADLSDDTREKILTKSIIDYVYKATRQDIDYIISIANRVKVNSKTKVIVVDDSLLYRRLISDLLKINLYNVLEASNGKECLELLRQNNDVKLVLTDYNMPIMDGFELTAEIRKTYGKDSIAILAISDSITKNISSRFLKIGANDFIGKPFSKEEFYCRVNLNMDILENFEKVKNLANKDFLTGCFNRRYFFDRAQKILAGSDKLKSKVALAMIDIDFFKKINDTYGHDAGDIALKFLANILMNIQHEKSIIARFGGEEFVIFLYDIGDFEVGYFFEALKKNIASTPVKISNETIIHFTVSIGISTGMEINIEKLISIADELLYKAKHEGRNRVCLQ